MTKKIRLGVIFGGRSGEHEVSERSARSVIEAADQEKYEVVPIAITKEGRWLSPAVSAALLPETAQRKLSGSFTEAGGKDAVVIDPSRGGLLRPRTGGGESDAQRLDVVFPVMHGTYGEDGTIQGLLEMAGIPYVGCGVLASSCGMDKVTMKTLFLHAGLPLCKYLWFLRHEWESSPANVHERVTGEIGYPCFVKPANLGSSVGISRASDAETLVRAINLAARYDRKIIVEEGLDVREIECAVMGNDEPEASLPGEYVVLDEQAKFLDYTEKYSSTGHVDFVVPAPISKRLTARIQELAVRAFKAIDGAGFARVDFFLRRDTNKLLLNELNTIPGLTDVSGFPKMWDASGVTFTKAIDRLVDLAFERHAEKSRNLTSL
ncbi:MAG: D-alanine-D-alanine ligase [Acidobacteriota bacterium]|jgi:D-alanine-D-alanine ligase|nr:D-alanine-D-alanine ligase [Acidobacteriota bacterium]MDT7780880.1 D-alanine-D-alanine ligase [Acidobacteriota bacterium]